MEQAEEVVKYQELEEGEFPLLAQFAQPYQPPKESAILRIRTIDYLGEKHPLEYKVVLQVSPSKLGLTPTQLHKFLILAGPRYDPIRKELKISSERYQNRTMNLKWASNTLDRLIAEAKDPKETFADVPLTFPHSKPKPSYPFPSEWRMSKGEAEELKESWKAIEEEQLVETTEMEGEGEVKVEEQQLPSSDGPSSPQAS
ncbi:mitochondrial ribosomal subunit protein-domain-containing protein [Piptocephalis cylindrospora]|uniref:Mitochondrial ribosomal subunit protein-domain-containing protein n=1 Tax=Piptocephalis cylindrospora TaxID=1907219 RepID=A0A4P9Y8F1_9FUNG|nr:mitochondrial ribosomal subunit protein-domain-containing protein [Piptocephalis cylindrospora]|eukprot:RKP15353.1 mitochondrial ribosomal subunit protein-domain-containing protein [Piptocephalis cylindrospora]